MTKKAIGWATLPVCLITIGIAVRGSLRATPQTAFAAAVPRQVNVAPVTSAVPVETTQQVCQSVLSRIFSLQQTLIDEKRSRRIKPLAAMDQLVAQEYQIDTSKCPIDFRLAIFRFVMTEDTARLHAHMDETGETAEVLSAAEVLYATHGQSASKFIQSPEYDETLSRGQKKDLANTQSARLDVARVAMKYCGN